MNTLPTAARTAFPVCISKMRREFLGVFHEVQACGGNLDAPESILTGGLFFGRMSHCALVDMRPRGWERRP